MALVYQLQPVTSFQVKTRIDAPAIIQRATFRSEWRSVGWGNAVSFLEKRDIVYERPVTSGKLLAPKFANDSKRDPDNFVFERELSSRVSHCVYFNGMARDKV